MTALGRHLRRTHPRFYGFAHMLWTGEFEVVPPRRTYAERPIHRIIKALFMGRPGYFIEAGANDGIARSNTYYLERHAGWHGLLIEPLPHRAEQCRLNRPASRTVNAALVAPGYDGATVDILDMDRMATVLTEENAIEVEQHLAKFVNTARRYRKPVPRIVTHQVPAATLARLLAEAGNPHVDFFSLDVEGLELEVLKGLDFDRVRPDHILVEDWDRQGVGALLREQGYQVLRQIGDKDTLFRHRDVA